MEWKELKSINQGHSEPVKLQFLLTNINILWTLCIVFLYKNKNEYKYEQKNFISRFPKEIFHFSKSERNG